MLYVCTVCTKKAKAQHGTAAKTMKMKPKIRKEKKIPVPSRVIIFCLIGTPYTRSKRRKEKNRTEELLSQPRTPPAPLATISQPIRSGQSFPPSLPHSEPRRQLHVKPGAHRGPPSRARQSRCSECVALSLIFIFCLKNKHRLNCILHIKTTLRYSFIV